MTLRLREDRAALDRALRAVRDVTAVPIAQLEKDFWLTEALRGIAATAAEIRIPIFLKGGTSLSKVFGIIERFSEDVDVLVGLPHTDALMSARRRDAVLRQLITGAVEARGLVATTEPAATRKGEKRAVHLHHPHTADAGPPAWALVPLRPEGVLVELGRWGGSQPHVRAEVSSIIADHADRVGLPAFEEQQPVAIDVVDPVRTAIEKLALLHAAAAQDDERRRRSVARHYYDVWCLLEHPRTAAELSRPGLVAAIAEEVLLQTLAVTPEQHHASVHERPLAGFAQSPAFHTAAVRLAPVRQAYEAVVLGELVRSDATARPSFEECCRAVRGFPGGL